MEHKEETRTVGTLEISVREIVAKTIACHASLGQVEVTSVRAVPPKGSSGTDRGLNPNDVLVIEASYPPE